MATIVRPKEDKTETRKRKKVSGVRGQVPADAETGQQAVSGTFPELKGGAVLR